MDEMTIADYWYGRGFARGAFACAVLTCLAVWMYMRYIESWYATHSPVTSSKQPDAPSQK